ncbi:MAG: HAD-IA family hydrolase [Devosia sp.]|nr:HAD-IA family hydrolase [Devosia sp.]
MRPVVPTLQALASDPPRADGYLIDLDGTLLSGSSLLPGAVTFLSELRAPFVILSNDSEHVPQQIAAIFRKNGLPLGRRDVVLAGAVAIEAVAERSPGARIMLMASPALCVLARRLGLRLDTDAPEIVLVARDRAFSFDKLALAARAVRRGASVVLACPDTSHPGPVGDPVPEAGALAAALFACTGPVPFEVIGKPEPTLFRIGCERLGIQSAQCLMIGDNPLTDGAGASRAGIAFCQVAGIADVALAD